MQIIITYNCFKTEIENALGLQINNCLYSSLKL